MAQNIEAGQTNRPSNPANLATPPEGLDPVGAEGAQLKQKITDEKKDAKAEDFDPGMSMLGTDNEAGSAPDHDGMAEARKNSQPG